jgi:hypothetical protein
MLSLSRIVGALALAVHFVAARPPVAPSPPKQPPILFGDDFAGHRAAVTIGPYFFDQVLDHSNPSLGTFQQRYWFYEDYYRQGGPIVLFNACVFSYEYGYLC